MKAALQVRLSQHLALTPQLQQSIRLLQLSTLELQQEIEQMLDANPFLEVDREDDGDDSLSFDAAVSSATTREGDLSHGPAASEGGDEPAGLDANADASFEREDWSNGTEGDDFDSIAETRSSAASPTDDDDNPARERVGEGPTLTEHLREQLVGMRLSPLDALALHALIESLNDEGYLADPLEAIAERLHDDLQAELGDAPDDDLAELLDDPAATPGSAHQPMDLAAWQDRLGCALRWLHSMEPAGVGGRDLAECLSLQLRRHPRSEAQAVAVIIVKNHLDLLAKRDYRKLGALTGAEDELLREAQTLIVACDPKPGRAFSRTEHNIVVPDVIVRKSGRGVKVALNPDVVPKLCINDLYAQAMRGQRGQGTLGVRLQEARWFVKNVKQRFDTILRVATAIVERQRSFFTHGEIAMRPLVLREIADELGLHESTISRVTTAKYMATPLGTFELKYFFGSSLATEAGGNASSTAVRALIRQFVSAEDQLKPLSDNQLATMLSEQGIQVARRTVAKYREALRIAPANMRRTL